MDCPSTPFDLGLTSPGPRPLRPLPSSDLGATAVEYALLLAFIAAVIIAAVSALGLTTGGMFVVPCLNGASCP